MDIVRRKKLEKECRNALRLDNILLITGKAGSGKSTLSLMIIHHLTQEIENEVYVLKEADEWREVTVSSDKAIFILIEDFCDASVSRNNGIEDWRGLIDEIDSCARNKNAHLIINIDCDIFDTVKQEIMKITNGRQLFDISKVWTLSTSEKKIFFTNMYKTVRKSKKDFKISQKEKEEICSFNPIMGFFNACHAFFKFPENFKLKSEFFKKSENNYGDVIKIMFNENFPQYAALLCLLMTEAKGRCVMDIGKLNQICMAFKKELQTQPMINKSMDELMSLNLIERCSDSDELFTFSNNEIILSVLQSIAKKECCLLLDLGSQTFIAKRLRSSKYKPLPGDSCVCVGLNDDEALALKLFSYFDIDYFNVGSMKHESNDENCLRHPTCSDSHFLRLLLGKIRNKFENEHTLENFCEILYWSCFFGINLVLEQTLVILEESHIMTPKVLEKAIKEVSLGEGPCDRTLSLLVSCCHIRAVGVECCLDIIKSADKLNLAHNTLSFIIKGIDLSEDNIIEVIIRSLDNGELREATKRTIIENSRSLSKSGLLRVIRKCVDERLHDDSRTLSVLLSVARNVRPIRERNIIFKELLHIFVDSHTQLSTYRAVVRAWLACDKNLKHFSKKELIFMKPMAKSWFGEYIEDKFIRRQFKKLRKQDFADVFNRSFKSGVSELFVKAFTDVLEKRLVGNDITNLLTDLVQIDSSFTSQMYILSEHSIFENLVGKEVTELTQKCVLSINYESSALEQKIVSCIILASSSNLSISILSEVVILNMANARGECFFSLFEFLFFVHKKVSLSETYWKNLSKCIFHESLKLTEHFLNYVTSNDREQVIPKAIGRHLPNMVLMNFDDSLFLLERLPLLRDKKFVNEIIIACLKHFNHQMETEIPFMQCLLSSLSSMKYRVSCSTSFLAVVTALDLRFKGSSESRYECIRPFLLNNQKLNKDALQCILMKLVESKTLKEMAYDDAKVLLARSKKMTKPLITHHSVFRILLYASKSKFRDAKLLNFLMKNSDIKILTNWKVLLILRRAVRYKSYGIVRSLFNTGTFKNFCKDISKYSTSTKQTLSYCFLMLFVSFESFECIEELEEIWADVHGLDIWSTCQDKLLLESMKKITFSEQSEIRLILKSVTKAEQNYVLSDTDTIPCILQLLSVNLSPNISFSCSSSDALEFTSAFMNLENMSVLPRSVLTFFRKLVFSNMNQRHCKELLRCCIGRLDACLVSEFLNYTYEVVARRQHEQHEGLVVSSQDQTDSSENTLRQFHSEIKEQIASSELSESRAERNLKNLIYLYGAEIRNDSTLFIDVLQAVFEIGNRVLLERLCSISDKPLISSSMAEILFYEFQILHAHHELPYSCSQFLESSIFPSLKLSVLLQCATYPNSAVTSHLKRYIWKSSLNVELTYGKIVNNHGTESSSAQASSHSVESLHHLIKTLAEKDSEFVCSMFENILNRECQVHHTKILDVLFTIHWFDLNPSNASKMVRFLLQHASFDSKYKFPATLHDFLISTIFPSLDNEMLQLIFRKCLDIPYHDIADAFAKYLCSDYVYTASLRKLIFEATEISAISTLLVQKLLLYIVPHTELIEHAIEAVLFVILELISMQKCITVPLLTLLFILMIKKRQDISVVLRCRIPSSFSEMRYNAVCRANGDVMIKILKHFQVNSLDFHFQSDALIKTLFSEVMYSSANNYAQILLCAFACHGKRPAKESIYDTLSLVFSIWTDSKQCQISIPIGGYFININVLDIISIYLMQSILTERKDILKSFMSRVRISEMKLENLHFNHVLDSAASIDDVLEHLNTAENNSCNISVFNSLIRTCDSGNNGFNRPFNMHLLCMYILKSTCDRKQIFWCFVSFIEQTKTNIHIKRLNDFIGCVFKMKFLEDLSGKETAICFDALPFSSDAYYQCLETLISNSLALHGSSKERTDFLVHLINTLKYSEENRTGRIKSLFSKTHVRMIIQNEVSSNQQLLSGTCILEYLMICVNNEIWDCIKLFMQHKSITSPIIMTTVRCLVQKINEKDSTECEINEVLKIVLSRRIDLHKMDMIKIVSTLEDSNILSKYQLIESVVLLQMKEYEHESNFFALFLGCLPLHKDENFDKYIVHLDVRKPTSLIILSNGFLKKMPRDGKFVVPWKRKSESADYVLKNAEGTETVIHISSIINSNGEKQYQLSSYLQNNHCESDVMKILLPFLSTGHDFTGFICFLLESLPFEFSSDNWTEILRLVILHSIQKACDTYILSDIDQVEPSARELELILDTKHGHSELRLEQIERLLRATIRSFVDSTHMMSIILKRYNKLQLQKETLKNLSKVAIETGNVRGADYIEKFLEAAICSFDGESTKLFVRLCLQSSEDQSSTLQVILSCCSNDAFKGSVINSVLLISLQLNEVKNALNLEFILQNHELINDDTIIMSLISSASSLISVNHVSPGIRNISFDRTTDTDKIFVKLLKLYFMRYHHRHVYQIEACRLPIVDKFADKVVLCFESGTYERLSHEFLEIEFMYHAMTACNLTGNACANVIINTKTKLPLTSSWSSEIVEMSLKAIKTDECVNSIVLILYETTETVKFSDEELQMLFCAMINRKYSEGREDYINSLLSSPMYCGVSEKSATAILRTAICKQRNNIAIIDLFIEEAERCGAHPSEPNIKLLISDLCECRHKRTVLYLRKLLQSFITPDGLSDDVFIAALTSYLRVKGECSEILSILKEYKTDVSKKFRSLLEKLKSDTQQKSDPDDEDDENEDDDDSIKSYKKGEIERKTKIIDDIITSYFSMETDQ
ncbi:hypothetical protein FSP39_011691 [Pinctada imbricata]|uniref:Novel STAND NTPase 3 domain-containing protein n=1 Tax=Pinctada imbricata TaxID=66713 RepID=A0AA89BM82_PINIB|nr:hypothetical protein FSP39_011691 [Pinctada imbricata]